VRVYFRGDGFQVVLQQIVERDANGDGIKPMWMYQERFGSPPLPGGANSFIVVLPVGGDEIGEVLVGDDGTCRTFEPPITEAGS
jgi:hypothetical protein